MPLLVLAPLLALAEISFGGQTRFIMSTEHSRKTVEIANHEDRDNLVQIDLEWGDGRAGELPVVVSQPLLLISPRGKKILDILYAGEGLPDDRESFFLLNVLEVPMAASEPNVLQLTLRHRMKLFYRPKLPSSLEDATAGLRWRLDMASASPLMADNPSPYYLTLTDLQAFDAHGQACGLVLEHMMLMPFSAQSPQLPGCSGTVARIDFQVVSDTGRPRPYRAFVQAGADARGVPLPQ